MTSSKAASRIAEIAVAISDKAAFEDVCEALESGRLTIDSAGPSRSTIARGDPVCESGLRALQETWRQECPSVSPPGMALIMRSSARALALARERAPGTEIVWTGPTVASSFLRATRAVAREIIGSATRELLVVGYWFASRHSEEGIVQELIEEMAQRVTRGVAVTIVADERIRSDGRHNRQVLMEAWPSNVAAPKILTWRLTPQDPHVKLHAKVLAADRKDALVTSANFTSHAFETNIEMGVRVKGRPAADVARHFELLALHRVLTPYEADQPM